VTYAVAAAGEALRRSYLAVGLTGGIGSGKTVVADGLQAAGAAVVDADVLAHRVTGPQGAAIEPIRSCFGASYIDAHGALNRAAMRRRVFADTPARRQLEAIVHPLVRLAADAEAEQHARSGAPYVVFAIPLLIEAGDWTSRVDRVLLVDAPQALQVLRVMQRSGLAADQVLAIIAQQASRAQRLAAASDVLVNVGPRQALSPRIERLHRQYLQLARQRSAAATAGL
jgi:dephospho-CoA kinase